jgi:hypothetical protein
MKILLIFLLGILPFCANSAELDSVTLITPILYKKDSKLGENTKSELTAGVVSVLNIDIEKKVSAKIDPYKKDLQKYFPKAGELDVFVKNVTQAGIKENLSKVNDDNLTKFYRYLGNNLIGKIADKILETEGVADSLRRSIWVNKLTGPFNSCMDAADNFQYDANHCIDALTSSLVPSTGIGIVYELSRSSLDSALPEEERTPFNYEQVNLYKTCLAKTKSTSKDVMSCALGAMRAGVEKVANTSLTKTIAEKSTSTEKADEIKKQVWPKFKSCSNQVGSDLNNKKDYKGQFFDCIDNLVQSTGVLLVNDKISNTTSIKEIFPAEKSVELTKKLAAEKSNQFAQCVEEQKKAGQRKNGMLDIDQCQIVITNEVTYKVVTETFKKTAAKTLRTEKDHGDSTGKQGVLLLDKCWSNTQTKEARESCLRKSIISFSQTVATKKLDRSIPAGMPAKDELSTSSVSSLSQCIDKNLPSNISEAKDLTARLDSCTGKLTHDVALKVAEYQIRDTAKGNLSAEMTDNLIKELVEKEFSQCIGASPSDEELSHCSATLTLKAGKQISEVSFPKEINSYLNKAGGLKALGLTQEKVDDFVSTLNKSTQTCIDRKLLGTAMEQVSLCIKNSVRNIAFFFGETQFNNSMGDMYAKREGDKKVIEGQFKTGLDQCLATKDGKEFSIRDYTNNLYTCSEKISKTTTITVGEDQIDNSLNTYLKDRPGVDLKALRSSVKATVLEKFKLCMEGTSKSSQCIDSLKSQATNSIVINYGRVEMKSQINASVTPLEIKPVEDELTACTDSPLDGKELTAHLDECTKNFALNFARSLGALKLNTLLRQTLGSDLYQKQKGDIDTSLEQYNSCLDGLKKYTMSDGLTDKLKICTDGLTNRGMNIVRSNINTWMSTEEKDAAVVMIKQEFANFLPCLSALIPASPYTPQLQKNVESSVKPLAILLSHYIEYNPENAQQTLQGIITKLSVDLTDVAQTDKAKRELLDFLYQSGALDQFIKAIVRGTVQDALTNVSEKDVPRDLREILLRKENFEEIFNSPDGSKIKDVVLEKILRPTLLNNESTQSPAYVANMQAIKDNVVKLLLNAPSFGEQAIKLSIQNRINDMGGVTKFVAKTIYGANALDWEKVRLTEEGKKAEAYIKDYMLMPKFKGVHQTPAETKKINDEAEKLVKKAVKSYG